MTTQSTVDKTEDRAIIPDEPTAPVEQDDSRKRIDDLATDAPEVVPEPEKGEPKTEPVAQPAKVADEAKKTVSPIQEAIDQLTTDKPDKPEPSKVVTKPAAVTSPTPGKAGQDETDAKPATADPFADWSREERKHTKGTVKQRFAEMSAKLKQYDEAAKESGDFVEVGKSWDQLIEKHGLDTDVGTLNHEQIAWTIKSQAAVVRTMQAVAGGKEPNANDLKILDTVRAGLAEVDRHLGREASNGPSLDMAKLDQLVKEAGETLDFDALNAFLAAAKQTKKEPAKTPAKTPAETSNTALPNPERTPQTERQQQDSDLERQIYANRFLAQIAKHGVAPEQTVGWFNANVLPRLDKIIRRDFPGQRPEVVYARLPRALKHEMHMESLREWEAEKKSAPTKPRNTNLGDRPLRTTGGGSAGQPKPGSFVSAAIDRLTTDR